uniref:Predicted protein n=1 Tax=Hordeum vulgare subsp. vulgare TaxID=112509 RepID=F2DRS7_HORVV|nr:predicted protein [Hordeum vulgare subsp. vulgare]
MPLNKPKVVIAKGGIHGHCWFAGEDIKEGEWIWKRRDPGAPHTDVFLTWAEIQAMPQQTRDDFMALAYQVDDTHYCGFDPNKPKLQEELEEDWVNHSCDGNAWYENDDLLVAMRYIKKGEEICYDYCLTEANPDWKLADGNRCLCGTALCRGSVSGNDWKLPHLRAKYGRHFLAYVLKRIDELEQRPS